MSTASIIGVGQSAYGRSLPQSARELAAAAILAAVEDAGLDPAEVDGVLSFSGEFERVDIPTVHKLLGCRSLSLYAQVPFGGEAVAGAVRLARDAIAGGGARHIVIYRSLSSPRPPKTGAPASEPPPPRSSSARGAAAFALPFGVASPAQSFALAADRYRRDAGVSPERFEDALGTVAVTARTYAADNPVALLRERPLSLADHHASRMISSPLRRDDMCLVNDGAAAVVVSQSPRQGRHAAVHVLGAVQNLDPYGEPFGLYTSSPALFSEPSQRVYADAGMTPRRVRVAALYDASTFTTLALLEQTGLVAPNQAVPYILDVGLGPQSGLPVNPHGGHLAEAYIHGLNGLIEVVRQLRGDASTPVPGADVGLFASPLGSAVLLGAAA